MANVATVGTPAALSGTNRVTATPVAGIWGTGQNRTAGNCLVACVDIQGSTSVTSITTPSGWNLIGIAGTSTKSCSAMYYKFAAGADAVPSFTFSATGTVVGECTMYELSNVNATVPVDTFGTSTAVSGTHTTSTAVTSDNVTSTTGLSIGTFSREATAATTTITASGSGTLDTNDGSVSSVGHSGTVSGATLTAGSTLTSGIAFASATTVNSGIVAVFLSSSVSPGLRLSASTTFFSTTNTTSYTTTTSISPSAGAEVAVCVAALATIGGTAPTMADSHGNNLTLNSPENQTSNSIWSGIFTFTYSTAPGATTYTLTVGSGNTCFNIGITPVTVTGQANPQSGAVSSGFQGSTSGVCETTSTASAAGSYILLTGYYEDASASSRFTAISGTSIMTQTPVSGGQNIYGVFKSSATTTGTGSVNYGCTTNGSGSGHTAISSLEIQPAPTATTPTYLFMPFFM